jgi:hypothetical protein
MKKLLSGMLVFSLMTVSAFAAFDDVSENTDYYHAIEWMADNGVINGYGDGTFGPDNCVTRGEILKMLFEMLEVDENLYEDDPFFIDTPVSEWYTIYAQAARERGTVKGYDDGTFRPTQCVTRAEAVKMGVKEFGFAFSEYDEEFDGTGKYYMDVGHGDWFDEYIAPSLNQKLIGLKHVKIYDDQDFPNEEFGPNKSMSRKEVAEMLYSMKSWRDNADTNIGKPYEGFPPDDIVTKFDGCGSYDDYKDINWWSDLQSAYTDSTAYADIEGRDLEATFMEGCFALDESRFIFIGKMTSAATCGDVYRYDIVSSELELAPNYKSGMSGYCTSEFKQRVGAYILVDGEAGFSDGMAAVEQKYYIEDNYVE